MSKRIDLAQTQPAALSAMLNVENYLSLTVLCAKLKELIKIRASMINQCAYCIEMHTTEALKAGIEQQKLFAISAWKESPLFDDKERAILSLTDEMTLIADSAVSDATYQTALKQLGEEQLAEAMIQVIMINAWNRFALATQMQH
ncbi:carboxymuconolactone decarboxylase family protein [uncultured Shewanella sp.]|uniref:carboxymuconolactone decarboxylase family protein n=1 Tax=uncultured Shewanella sp. TaxID=173975 RepID=UPI0026079D10|nr:carboxymuconolactone decarboxylase family protein [uncultured Shewanella sp.]